MPRWASRLTLEVTTVRVERLQEIAEADSIAEGIERIGIGLQPLYGVPTWAVRFLTAKTAYAQLWDSINAKRGFGWSVNPWVWVVAFKRIEVLA